MRSVEILCNFWFGFELWQYMNSKVFHWLSYCWKHTCTINVMLKKMLYCWPDVSSCGLRHFFWRESWEHGIEIHFKDRIASSASAFNSAFLYLDCFENLLVIPNNLNWNSLNSFFKEQMEGQIREESLKRGSHISHPDCKAFSIEAFAMYGVAQTVGNASSPFGTAVTVPWVWSQNPPGIVALYAQGCLSLRSLGALWEKAGRRLCRGFSLLLGNGF